MTNRDEHMRRHVPYEVWMLRTDPERDRLSLGTGRSAVQCVDRVVCSSRSLPDLVLQRGARKQGYILH